jgi:hypothetical protein
MLSGLIDIARGCPAVQFTTGRLEAPSPRSSRTQGPLLSRGNTSRRYYRTVSRRTEPSSCGILMDEQPNPWPLLHDQDIPSRQRCTKPRGRYVRDLSPFSYKTKNYAAVYSHPRRACYLQGSLSDSLNPHQRDFKVR